MPTLTSSALDEPLETAVDSRIQPTHARVTMQSILQNDRYRFPQSTTVHYGFDCMPYVQMQADSNISSQCMSGILHRPGHLLLGLKTKSDQPTPLSNPMRLHHQSFT